MYRLGGAGEGTRTPTVARQNLNLVRLPIPPHPHVTLQTHEIISHLKSQYQMWTTRAQQTC